MEIPVGVAIVHECFVQEACFDDRCTIEFAADQNQVSFGKIGIAIAENRCEASGRHFVAIPAGIAAKITQGFFVFFGEEAERVQRFPVYEFLGVALRTDEDDGGGQATAMAPNGTKVAPT